MQQYVVANWKMYTNWSKAQQISKGMVDNMLASTQPLPKVVLCPPYPYLIPVYENTKGTTISLGAQDCYPEKEGPHTGEVSVSQVKDVHAEYVIIGHSERRQERQEGSKHIKRKVEAVIAHGMVPILCVGESEEERKNGQALEKVVRQLKDETPKRFSPKQLIVAYEPLWCIATNHIPTKKQIEEMHGAISHELQQLQPNGNLVPVLYGGSVHPQNAQEVLSCKGVRGVLVGRSSLKLDDLWAIVNSSKT